MIPLRSEKRKVDCKEQVCYICKKEFSTDDNERIAFNKEYHKVRCHCHHTEKYKGAIHDISTLRHKTPKQTSAVFYNGSTYNYNFTIKKTSIKFDSQFECLRESTEKMYYFFSTN